MTWKQLNNELRSTKTEAQVVALLEQEMAQVYPRERWVVRIHCRLRKLRSLREKKELQKLTKGLS